jgi:predicted metal-dependent peptidase
LGQNESNNQTVETKSFAENENQNHADEQLGLLTVGAHTSVTDNADSETGSQSRETTRKTGSQVGKAVERRVRGLD